MATPDDKALVASSEFDPQQFVRGIDTMVASLTKLAKTEEDLRGKLGALNQQLGANRQALAATQQQMAALDKSSTTYKNDLDALARTEQSLRAQQTTLNTELRATQTQLGGTTKQVNDYKTALSNLGATATQVLNQNKGKTLFDTQGLNAQIAELTQAGGRLRGIFAGAIDDQELVQLEQRLGETSDEFTQLAEVVDFVRQKLETLDPNVEGFAELTQIVSQGEQVLAGYSQTQETVVRSSQSLRGRLTELRTTMVQLEDQGKENTQEFRNLQVEAGRLQNSIEDAQDRIRVLASDTKAVDFGLGVARAGAAAFSLYAGALELAGIRSEDALQTIARLNAVMAVLNGLQEIQNLLKKQSVVLVVGEELAMKAAAVTQRIYAVAVGTSTGAMRAFRVALLATGIGAFVVLLGLAADAMGVFDAEVKATTVDVTALNEALQTNEQLMDSRARAIRTAAALDEERARQSITNETALQARLTAIRLRSIEEEKGSAQRALTALRQTQDDFLNKGLASPEFIEQSNRQALAIFNRIQELDAQLVVERAKALTKQIEDQRKAYRDYLDRLLALQRQLRDAQLAQEPQDAARIQEALTNTLSDALDDLDREVRRGTLTRGRADVLAALLRQINRVEVEDALREFNLRAEEAVRDGAETIRDLQLQVAQERAELLRDQLTREARLLQANARQERTALIRERDELLRGIQATQREGLISPEQAQENAERVRLVFEDLLTNLAIRLSRQQEELAGTAFRLAQEQLQRTFDTLGLTISEAATTEVIEATRAYQAGRTTYQRYQQELTRIARDETRRRTDLEIREAEGLLANLLSRRAAVERANALAARTNQAPDTATIQALREEEVRLREQIAQLRRQLAIAGADEDNADRLAFAAKVERLAQYAQAVGNVVSSVVAFWQQANAAEERSLERSIRLQERRVEAATRIAERGNAEYLRLEQDRLDELQVKQENAARRQLAINAVLQTSQALTAFVSALAQGIATGGPLGGIAIAAAVIGLIASGYAIIQSLSENNTPRLKKGTKYVRGDGRPDGDDTVPAMLTKGEAVVPVRQNKDYHPAVAAIIDQKVPAAAINRFVQTYHHRTVAPRLDYDKLGVVAEVAAQGDERLLREVREQNKLLREQNEELKGVNHRLKHLGVSVNMDKNGLVISVLQAMHEYELSKNA